MKENNVGRVYQQLVDLENRCDAGVLDRALISAKLHCDGYQATEEQYLKLADRIYKVCVTTDEPRFTWYDYADAIINWPAKINTDRLLELADNEFEEVIIYMAFCKRRTYSYDVKTNLCAEELVNQLQAKLAPVG